MAAEVEAHTTILLFLVVAEVALVLLVVMHPPVLALALVALAVAVAVVPQVPIQVIGQMEVLDKLTQVVVALVVLDQVGLVALVVQDL